MSGKVYLVGGGPGKPDLITVRGRNILKAADVVIHDYLVDKSILKYAADRTEIINCALLGKKQVLSGKSDSQRKINELLVKKARLGKKVVRLKNGDPSIFGRCAEECEALLKNNIEFEIVPGVTSGVAASSINGIPLTDREIASSCVFVTGREAFKKKDSFIEWRHITGSGTVVLYMGVGALDNIVNKLLESGKSGDTPVAIIQEASLITERAVTGTLRDISEKAKEAGIKPPAVIIIGEVVALAKRFNWIRNNRRILFTGLSEERFFLKGTCFHLPLIEIKPLKDYAEFDRHLKRIKNFDWIIFASRYGVEYFFKRLRAVGEDSRVLCGIKIAVIGGSTGACLSDHGILADLIPRKESSRGLIEAFQKLKLEGKKIFLPRSDISDKGLERKFEGLGARVTSSFAYTNVMPPDLPELDLKEFDEIMFTSPSTVRNFKKRYVNIPEGIKVTCIGDVTLKEARRCGLLD